MTEPQLLALLLQAAAQSHSTTCSSLRIWVAWLPRSWKACCPVVSLESWRHHPPSGRPASHKRVFARCWSEHKPTWKSRLLGRSQRVAAATASSRAWTTATMSGAATSRISSVTSIAAATCPHCCICDSSMKIVCMDHSSTAPVTQCGVLVHPKARQPATGLTRKLAMLWRARPADGIPCPMRCRARGIAPTFLASSWRLPPHHLKVAKLALNPVARSNSYSCTLHTL